MVLLNILFSFTVLLQTPAEALINSGYNKYLDDDYVGAIEDFTKASEIAPQNEEIYYLRGVCKSNINEKAAAMVDYNRALKLNPNYAEVYYEKAYIYLQDQNPVEAIKALDKVLELQPNMAAAYVSRGTAKCMMEDIDGANKDWRRAKELGIDYSDLMICE
ncbi:MAG: tetratricopeptide repeat protein [Bacteroidota bacterium]